MKRALFAGSFDPFTIAHADIVRRGLMLFDEVVIAIGDNYTKNSLTSVEERLETIRAHYKDNTRVSVISYQGLTVDTAKELEATALLRGVRSVQDYEYERQIADTNYALSGIETVLLTARPELAHISSTLVRDLKRFGKDVKQFLP